MSRGRLVLMGSGETAPSMVEVHRASLRAAGEGRSWLLDSPYGFQENADDLTAKALAYFQTSVGRELTPLVWRERLEGADLDRALAAVRGARSVFAGPGSPTYALRVWRDSGLVDAVAALVAAGGTATFASAAALAVGVRTVPVYEIYKCGLDVVWADGLDLLERLTGLRAAVIPHYDNSEGGTHSTRFCYLGEHRLRELEGQLPDGAHVIGIDEHTALVIDLEQRTAEVRGNGGVTVRVDGASRVLPTGTTVPLEQLAAEAREGEAAAAGAVAPPEGGPHLTSLLRDSAEQARRRYDAAIAAGEADAAAAAALDVEDALAVAGATLDADDLAFARRTLRGMVVELASVAREGLVDPAERLAPLVEALLAVRASARERKDFATSDEIRDRLAAAGVEVRDSPAGATWALTGA